MPDLLVITIYLMETSFHLLAFAGLDHSKTRALALYGIIPQTSPKPAPIFLSPAPWDPFFISNLLHVDEPFFPLWQVWPLSSRKTLHSWEQDFLLLATPRIWYQPHLAPHWLGACQSCRHSDLPSPPPSHSPQPIRSRRCTFAGKKGLDAISTLSARRLIRLVGRSPPPHPTHPLVTCTSLLFVLFSRLGNPLFVEARTSSFLNSAWGHTSDDPGSVPSTSRARLGTNR